MNTTNTNTRFTDQTNSAATSSTSTVLTPPVTSMHVTTATSVLLQTARVTVYNPNHPELSCDVRLIFDSGSQRSYLTHDVKQRLALEPIGSETLNIRTFGNNNEQRQQCDTVLVGMVAKEGTTLCIPLLTISSFVIH